MNRTAIELHARLSWVPRPLTALLAGLAVAVLTVGVHAAAPPPPPTKARPSWAALRSAYAVPAGKLVVRVAERKDPDYLVQHLDFTLAGRAKVPAIFIRPKKPGVYPCALLLHGWTSDKETMIRYFGRPLAARGIACVALDADRHGERRDPKRPQEWSAFGEVVRGGIVEERQVLKSLAERPDVDRRRIGLLGYSMGAIMGTILAGVDDRVRAAVLCVGGDPIRANLASISKGKQAVAEFVSPSNYAGHISPRPVMMINGRRDVIITPAMARLVHDAAREPKTVIWADSGHILPAAATMKGIEWLAVRLKG